MSQVYAGLSLWPAATTVRLVEAQLVEDGIYPNAETIFAEARAEAKPGGGEGGSALGAVPSEPSPTPLSIADYGYNPDQLRDPQGQWTSGGEGGLSGTPIAPMSTAVPVVRPASATPSSGLAAGLLGLLSQLNPIGTAQAEEGDLEEENRRLEQETNDPTVELRIQRYEDARSTLKEIDPNNAALDELKPSSDFVPTEQNIQDLVEAARIAAINRVCDFYRPNGQPIGQEGTSTRTRVMSGGLPAAQKDYDYLSVGGTPVPFSKGSMIQLPGNAGLISLRPITSVPGSPAIDINIPGVLSRKLHY